MLLTKGRTLLLCLGLLGAVLAAYANHFQNRFHFDDAPTVVENQFVRDLHNIPSFFKDARTFSANPAGQVYRPLVTTSLAIDYRLAHNDYKPFFFHLSTFLWFCVQLVLMFFLFRRIMEMADPHPSNLWTALLAAAFYGLHPAIAETVNYIIQRGDLYATLGVVASLFCFIAWPEQRKWGWYLIPAVLAYLSKPPALIFPLLLLVYVFLFEQSGTLNGWEKNRAKWIAAFRAVIPALLVTALVGILAWKMTSPTFNGGSLSPWLYRATQPWVALHYFVTFFLPAGLSADPGWPVVSNPFTLEALAGYLFLAALLAAAWWTSRRRSLRPIAFGILWFLIALLPTSLTALADVTNDHRMFFPFVGLALAVFWALRLVVFEKTARLTTNPLWVRGALGAVLVVLLLAGIGTHFRNQVWLNEESLWHDVTLKSPENPRGWMNYGLAFLTRHDFGSAYVHLQKAETLAPNYPPVEANLGLAAAGLDRPTEAEEHFRRALDLAPGLPESHLFYARWLLQVGRLRESKEQAEEALKINRLYLPARDLLGSVYARMGDTRGAEQVLEETIRLTFNDEVARRYMADRAEREKQAMAARFPSNMKPEELVNMSARFCREGNFPDCLAAAQRAADLRPAYAEAYNNMAAAYLAMGRFDDGIDAARKAIEKKPNYADAKNNLEFGLAQKAKAGKSK
jgi:protein O-mannosyl-transferase